MADEIDLGFNPLEARGLFMLQQGVLMATQAAEEASLALKNAEAQAAEAIAGRVPPGVTIREVRIDQQTSRAYATPKV